MSLSWAEAIASYTLCIVASSRLAWGAGFAAEVLQGEELHILNNAVSKYERAVGRSLEVGARPEPEQPSAAPAVVVEAHGSSSTLLFDCTDRMCS